MAVRTLENVNKIRQLKVSILCQIGIITIVQTSFRRIILLGHQITLQSVYNNGYIHIPYPLLYMSYI